MEVTLLNVSEYPNAREGVLLRHRLLSRLMEEGCVYCMDTRLPSANHSTASWVWLYKQPRDARPRYCLLCLGVACSSPAP